MSWTPSLRQDLRRKAIKPFLTWCHCMLTSNDNMYLKEMDEWQPIEGSPPHSEGNWETPVQMLMLHNSRDSKCERYQQQHQNISRNTKNISRNINIGKCTTDPRVEYSWQVLLCLGHLYASYKSLSKSSARMTHSFTEGGWGGGQGSIISNIHYTSENKVYTLKDWESYVSTTTWPLSTTTKTST